MTRFFLKSEFFTCLMLRWFPDWSSWRRNHPWKNREYHGVWSVFPLKVHGIFWHVEPPRGFHVYLSRSTSQPQGFKPDTSLCWKSSSQHMGVSEKSIQLVGYPHGWNQGRMARRVWRLRPTRRWSSITKGSWFNSFRDFSWNRWVRKLVWTKKKDGK